MRKKNKSKQLRIEQKGFPRYDVVISLMNPPKEIPKSGKKADCEFYIRSYVGLDSLPYSVAFFSKGKFVFGETYLPLQRTNNLSKYKARLDKDLTPREENPLEKLAERINKNFSQDYVEGIRDLVSQ